LTSKSRFPKIFCAVFSVVFLTLYIPRLFGLPFSGIFTSVRYVWHDFLFHVNLSAVKPGDPRLILLAVDVESGKEYGFPLPRVVYARALDKMRSLGVRTVLFDVMFFERREGDAELAAATKRFGRVIHLYAHSRKSSAGDDRLDEHLPVPSLVKAGRYFGHPNIEFLLDNDGHIRSFQLFRPEALDPLNKGFHAASIEAVGLGAFLDKSLGEVLESYGDDEKVLNFRLPKDWPRHEVKGGQETVFSAYRHISLPDLLSGNLSDGQRQALKGSIVIVGSTALGYYDKYPTPFTEGAPGAEYHLNVIDNLLNRDWMNCSSRALTLLLSLVAILLTYLLQRFSPALGAGLSAAISVSWAIYALWSFRRGVIVDFVAPMAAFASSSLALTVHRALTEGEEKKMIKSMFGQFVSPEIVNQLAQDPSKVKLGGEKREMTVFFLDIAHFTNISEKMDPEALILFLNRYLSALSHVILERRGTIDKYIGDCIMAFWNAPIENKDHRVDAILAALACQDALKELNKNLDPGVPEIPSVRIGINSGVVTVGLTGSEKKLQYTVIGDEVNLASRLEGANKFFGSGVIVSESAYAGCAPRIAARTLGRVRVVGKENPIRIFEPVGETSRLSAQWREGLPLYEQGVAAFESRKYDAALLAFQQFAKLFPQDGPGLLYLNRCQEYSVLPPDGTWDGVFNLTAK